jgi:small subunit ribosomal protein S6
MTKYELVFVLPGSFEKENLDKLSQKVKKIILGVDGEVVKETEPSLKHLSYSVKHERSGYYYFWDVNFKQSSLTEFRRLLNFETQILRYLLLKVAPEKKGK